MIRGKCIWSKEEGSVVYQDEVIGYFVTQEGIRILLRAPIAGKLAKIHFSVLLINILSYRVIKLSIFLPMTKLLLQQSKLVCMRACWIICA